MKTRIASLTILCLALVVIPAMADLRPGYDNGPINGTTDAWTINFGYTVSNTFTGIAFVDFFQIGVWEFPGDALSSVDWSITTQENGGTILGSGTASGHNVIDKFLSTNQYGYNIDQISVGGLGVNLNSNTTYWFNLQNATVPSGDPVYWDENSGVMCGGTGGGANCPAQASESAVGTIPSEAFTINSAPPPPVPEPGGILLFGSGVLTFAGVVRRKLHF